VKLETTRSFAHRIATLRGTPKRLLRTMLASALSSKLAFSTVVASKTTKVTKKTAVITKVIIVFFLFRHLASSVGRRACSQSSHLYA
jgi:hypothetical protein